MLIDERKHPQKLQWDDQGANTMTDKITIERETLQQVLDALDYLGDSSDRDVTPSAWVKAQGEKACGALRAALAAQPAEPVAWMPIESSPKDGSWMYVWRKHGTFPIQAKYNIKYAWFEDDDANHLYNLTHWMPLPAAPGAAPPAPAAPPGYVLVPIEPTQAILDAPFVGKVQPQDWHSHKRSRELMAENYRAMIAAAGDKP